MFNEKSFNVYRIDTKNQSKLNILTDTVLALAPPPRLRTSRLYAVAAPIFSTVEGVKSGREAHHFWRGGVGGQTQHGLMFVLPETTGLGGGGLEIL